MSSELRIQLRGVNKEFRSYRRPDYRVREMVERRQLHEKKHVLVGVDLDVFSGETFGLVGRNGAGKTTLLRLISGVMRPTSGEVRIHGTIAAVLSLGSTFEYDFSGRDNALMAGIISGMTRTEAEEWATEVLEFAELTAVMDEPVRTYSSGMFARLAFSTALCVKPHILLLDELLAVGDEFFADKCRERLADIRGAGAATVISSHNLESIQTLCDRALLLHQGRIQMVGEPEHVIESYRALHSKGGQPADRGSAPSQPRAALNAR